MTAFENKLWFFVYEFNLFQKCNYCYLHLGRGFTLMWLCVTLVFFFLNFHMMFDLFSFCALKILYAFFWCFVWGDFISMNFLLFRHAFFLSFFWNLQQLCICHWIVGSYSLMSIQDFLQWQVGFVVNWWFFFVDIGEVWVYRLNILHSLLDPYIFDIFQYNYI